MKGARHFLLMFLFAAFFSCNEAEDKTPPLVLISSPTEGSSFQQMDEILIRAQISDNEQIVSVLSNILYSDGETVAINGPVIFPTSPNVNFKESILVEDSLLPTGNYFVRIEANDGTNTIAAFRSIQITGIPKRKLSLMLVTDAGSSSQLWEDKNDFLFQQTINLGNRHHQSIFQARNQELWSAVQDGNELSVHNLISKLRSFNQSFTQNFSAPYESLQANGANVYYASKEELVAYTLNQAIRFSVFPAANRKFGKMQVGERYLLLEESDLVNTNLQLKILFNDNGAQFAAVYLNDPLVNGFFRGLSQAVLFQNKNGQGLIQELSVESSSISTILNLTDSIHEITQIDANRYLLSTNTGLYEFSYLNRSLTLRINIVGAKMAFDDLNQEVYVGQGNNVWRYSYPAFQLLQSGNSNQAIQQLMVRYNY